MKKLLITLFLTLGLIGTSHSNILDNLLGNMSYSDIKFYDTSFTRIPGGKLIRFDGKIKNLNQEKSIKEVYINLEVRDCNKGCKNCITAGYKLIPALEGNKSGTRRILPNNTFQFNSLIFDDTAYDSYVQVSGNETCFSSSIDKVEGFHIFE